MKAIRDLLLQGAWLLEEISPSAYLDASLILADQLGVSRTYLIAHDNEPVEQQICEEYLKKIERRRRYEPVAYITGKKEFFGLEFEVNPAVLIPRPETELLVELALKKAPEKAELQAVDLGTGSGCIAVALAVQLKKKGRQVKIQALDQSEAALEVAKRNAATHNVSDVITFITADWQSFKPETRYDLILSNPPYVALGDKNVSPETGFEPRQALYSGESGLNDVFYLADFCLAHLNFGCSGLIEIGSDQRQQIQQFFDKKDPRPQYRLHQDLSGKDRVLEIIS